MPFDDLLKPNDSKKSDNSGSQPDTTRKPERRSESATQAEGGPLSGRSTVVLCNPRIIATTEDASTVQTGFQQSLSLSLGGLNLGTAFKYLPLREGRFRLLEIVTPGVYPWCILKEHDLDNPPPYAALSYAWGLPITTRAMFCQNPGGEMASFSISEHVLEALNSLFAYVPKRHKIWIDAVCIDQSNSAEKAHQIAAMPRIYSQAQKVLCWLGAEADGSGRLVDSLPSMAQRAQQEFHPQFEKGGHKGNVSISIKDDELWISIIPFFLRPWFHRLWVVQEILMARELILVCGQKTISWDALVEATSELRLYHIAFDNPEVEQVHRCATRGIFELGQWRKDHRGAVINGLSQPELVRLLLWGSQREVTEPVDRIWALTGLARAEVRKTIAPLIDYSPAGRSNIHATFKAFTQAFLLQDEHLWLLSLVAITPKYEGLPSWCPSFGYSFDNWQLGLLQQDAWDYNAGYSEAEPLKPKVRFSSENSHLMTYGFVIDIIQDERSMPEPQNRELRLPFDQACLNLALECYPDRDKAIEAHSRTIIADRRGQIKTLASGEVISPSELSSIYATWRSYLEGHPHVASLNPEDKERLSKFKWLSGIATQRRYVSTFEGRVGLAPFGAQVGDLICILHGANTPYVFHTNGKEDPWTLVGDAYIHGIMYGEALSMTERQEEGLIVVS